MSAEEEIRWLEAWLEVERKREWVPWLKPIIRSNQMRLESLKKVRGGTHE